MKTINIKNAIVEEVIIRPNDNTPVSISYKLLEPDGTLITVRRLVVSKDELPADTLNALTTLSTKLLKKVELEEKL